MKDGCASTKTGKKRSIELPVLKNSPNKDTGIRHSRTSYWRAGALLALTALMVVHFIQWRMSGQTISPIEPSETMYTLQDGAVNAGFIFFTLAILATLIFGRFVCGWGCHIVALQDLSAWLLKKLGLKPRPFRSRLLVYVPLIVALYMFVWPTVSRYLAAPADAPIFPQFTNHLVTSNFWDTFPPLLVAIPFLFICGFMTVYFLGSKGFCTYACPYGGFFGVADKFAPGKIRVTDACNECGHCTAVCTSNVIVHAEVKQYGMVVDPGCMKCMDCVSVCPNDALYFGFGKPAIGVKKTVEKNYTLTWPEEIFGAAVFLFSFLAVWDVYQLVPMFMALGIACVTTFLAWKLQRMVRGVDVSFYRYGLKLGGKIRAAGWVFAALALAWIGLNAHSGFIRYHERAGAAAYQGVKIPDELALARTTDIGRWLGAGERTNIAEGKRHYQAAAELGLFVNTDALPKLAWLEYLSGNADEAVRLLGDSAEHQHGRSKALSLYYRGAIQNRLRSYDQALSSLDAAIAETPDLVLAHEERGEALWQLGRKDEAVKAWSDALSGTASLPIANSMLAGAAASQGNSATAADFEDQAAQYTPNDPLFHWVLGLRLQNVGMNELAEKHFARAIQLNPGFRRARTIQ